MILVHLVTECVKAERDGRFSGWWHSSPLPGVLRVLRNAPACKTAPECPQDK